MAFRDQHARDPKQRIDVTRRGRRNHQNIHAILSLLRATVRDTELSLCRRGGRGGHIDRRIERRVATGDTPELDDTIRVLVVAVMGAVSARAARHE